MSLPFSVAVTDPATARRARRLVAREVAAASAALTRELPRATLAAGRPVHLSHVLADLVRAALVAAQLTDGAVDPTVGTALLRSAHRWLPACGSAVGVLHTRRHTWQDVHLDGRWLTLPRDAVLDLNATAPGRTADRCATLIATRCGVGALVDVAGDVAAAGWPAARSRGVSRSPLIDPRTGQSAPRTARPVTVEAGDALTASALATAIALRPDAPFPPHATRR